MTAAGRARRGRVFAPATLGLLLATGLAAQAPDEPPETLDCTVEEVACFARIYLELNEIRDDLHQELALYHEAGRRRMARERADERIEAVFARYAVAAEKYEAFIGRVALEPELRDAFEEMVEKLRDGED